jgi:hypothetical protein
MKGLIAFALMVMMSVNISPQVKFRRLRNLLFYLSSQNQLIRLTHLVSDIFTYELSKRKEILNAIDHEVY